MSTDNDSESTPTPDLKHELRTYITAIMGYIELVREAYERQANKNRKEGRIPARPGEYLAGGQSAGSSGRRLRAGLGERLREWSRYGIDDAID